ncbi:MAG TPA: fibronectin type III domain-containing protein [Candidatus Polarisedimenticolia bacterium]|nr:fibronectin type III domain-containing protein [Candidatus Polarisedimenticolia bacterium]
MPRRWMTTLILAALPAIPVHAGESPRRQVRLIPLPAVAPASADWVHPEGKTRWDFIAAAGGKSSVMTLESREGAVSRQTRLPGAPEPREILFQDSGEAGQALEWLFPDRFPTRLRMGTRRSFELEEKEKRGAARLEIGTEIVGIGWLHLPSRPYEVVLQRCLLQRTGAGPVTRETFYRWISPLAGVVAEYHPDSRSGEPSDSYFLDATLDGAATLKIFSAQMFSLPFDGVDYGWDVPGTCTSSGTPCSLDSQCASGQDCVKNVATLTTPSYATMGALIAADTWDFSGNNGGTETSATNVPVSSAETCNFAQCGYTVPAGVLERLDKNFATPASTLKTNDVVEIEVRPADTTIWARAGSQKEGVSGSFGQGESRFCYTTFGGVTRTPVPLYRFPHQDVPGADFYMQAGDSWTSGVFNCEQNIFNQLCGASQFLDKLYSKSCSGHTGTQSGTVIKGGVVTLPSGHTFNALLLRITADFCVYAGSSCLFAVDDVRTFNYLWQVPYLGTAARLESLQVAADATSFSQLAETDIRFGLFPPRTIQVTGQTQTSISLSWDPGLDTHRINGYKVYWDTDSGSGSTYAFNSQANPGQASIVGTTATITGLAPGTSYYLTVTSLSNFTDPSTLATTTYESLLYPTQISGDPAFVYPVEVQATTQPSGCAPTAEAGSVTVNPTAVPGEIQICWAPLADPCLTGYRVLGSNDARNDTGWGTVSDLASGTTCWTGTPSQLYYLVVANGAGGTGPWGHYGH